MERPLKKSLFFRGVVRFFPRRPVCTAGRAELTCRTVTGTQKRPGKKALVWLLNESPFFFSGIVPLSTITCVLQRGCPCCYSSGRCHSHRRLCRKRAGQIFNASSVTATGIVRHGRFFNLFFRFLAGTDWMGYFQTVEFSQGLHWREPQIVFAALVFFFIIFLFYLCNLKRFPPSAKKGALCTLSWVALIGIQSNCGAIKVCVCFFEWMPRIPLRRRSCESLTTRRATETNCFLIGRKRGISDGKMFFFSVRWIIHSFFFCWRSIIIACHKTVRLMLQYVIVGVVRFEIPLLVYKSDGWIFILGGKFEIQTSQVTRHSHV